MSSTEVRSCVQKDRAKLCIRAGGATIESIDEILEALLSIEVSCSVVVEDRYSNFYSYPLQSCLFHQKQ